MSPSAASLLTAEKLCEITGLTDRRHRQLATAGYFPPPIKGKYQADATRDGVIRYQRELIGKRDERLAAEQLAYMAAKRRLAEEELAQCQGQNVSVALLTPALRNVALHQRAVMQFKFEQELAPNLAGLTTPEIIDRVRTAVDEICNILRDGIKEWTKSPPS